MDIYKLFDEVTELLKKEQKIKEKTFNIAWNAINKYFMFKNIKFSINFNFEDFGLSIQKKNKNKKLTKKQIEKLKKLGFESYNGWLWKCFGNNKEFFDYDAEKQLETFKKFYLDAFNSIKQII